MNDITTREIVAWVFERLGFYQIAKHVREEDTNIDTFINYIKYRHTKDEELRQFVQYYL
jgi:hypothetical protein